MFIQVINLSKIFKKNLAVNKINFHIEKNKTVGLLGPNGCGKTTSIGMMLGLINPSEGEILIDKKNLESLKTAMKRDYDRVFKNMASAHESFRYRQIMNLYRPGINPIRALYYQTRDVSRRYNPEHPYHYWLIDLVTDLEYNNIILDALKKDISKLERIIKRYDPIINTY